ncbi:Asp-tRNA(Asn)/Glu-tRNA(Gln) amidotransferase subunit GatC [Radicibacter daui]|jgi:aspartyl-tRNA(Asn)/glutamyl-tRNA(Gln) amidotransferase subunit C|uniref:Asp-tRNA(Asn)/Glu-tRNA(Gln) amidotransferase subunit GatC n=1 Tax=Radicibacter daui TaxID=3064829 RepID=UPI00404690A1
MSLDTATVRRIASLARIKVSDDALDHWTQEMNSILGWIEQLQQVNTDGVEPMSSVANMTLRQREDAITDGGIQDKVLANAPDATAGFYTVPKVVE